MILAEKIMTLRKKNGWSQEELAEQMNISRQSVSKWESGASIPDLERIIAMSKLFGVSTDYLLKDEEEKETPTTVVDVYEAPNSRNISVEEANTYMDMAAKMAPKMALATMFCVLCPVPLILLGAWQDYGVIKVSGNVAGGLGVMILLLMIAVAVAIFVLCGMRLEKYEYMEKERLALQYGVQGIVEKKKEDFSRKYQNGMVAGVSCCILAAIPLFVGLIFEASDVIMVYCTAMVLVLIAVGVFLFVNICTVQESYQKLLQEGDYTIEKKEMEKKTSFFNGAFWCVAVAIFLIWGFKTQDWGTAGLLFPVAALLFAAIKAVLKAIMKSKEGRN